jgi:hypothetical protein
VLLPTALPVRLQAATPLGVASAVLQMLGLLRWVVLVPLLAKAYADPSATPAHRQAIALVFEAQHQLFGVLMGEFAGQLLLALWTAGVALSVEARWQQRPLGLAAAALFLLGSADSLRMVLPVPDAFGPLPTIAFAVWSLWCALLGWIVLRPTPPILARRQPRPAPEVAMEHARFGKSQ